MINKKLLLLIFGIVVNFHSYSQWTDITSSIGGGLTSTTNMAKPYVFDVNNDNYPDFLVPVLTSVVSPYTKYWKLYKNNGNSTFTDATTSYGLPTNLSLSTLGFIDYNGDGFKDLYFYTATGLQILKNNNGTSFTDVSTQLGIASAFFISGEITSYPLKVFDYDLDGDEDLLYTRTISGANTLTAIVNNGTSFSTKVNIINSIPGATTGGINFSLFDMDNDGDFDIVFDAFSGTSQYSNGITTLYRKDAASYTNTTSTSGLANGLPGYISTIDINQDGNLDIVKGGADCCTSPLYRVFIGNGTGVFTEQTSTYSISNGGYKYNGTLTDFDNDTDFDFSWSNYTGTGAAPFRLYVNNGSNVFTENATTYGLNLGVTSGGVPIDDYGNGVWMDLDKDGDLDIILNREGSGSTSTTGNLWVKRNPLQGNYINIKLNGCGVNKSGIGAKIKLVVGTKTKWLYYEKSPDGNITNGTDTFHFGLGTATLINSITVYWPNNTTTVLNNVTGNQFLTIGGGAGGSSAPTASTSQTLCSGSTIANLSATGTNIKWYATSTGGNPLENTTALVTGTTYYASQTIGTCESTRTAVGVSINDPQITASTTTVCSGTTIQLDASNNLSNNVILENPVLSGLTQSNYTRGATTIKFYSWTYGLPGMLVYGDANQKYSSLEANIFVNNAVNAECSTGLAVGVKPNIFNDSYQYNGPGCYYLSMKNGRLSLLDGTANTPSGYWPNELIGVDIPEINFSLALNYKLKIEIKPNAHIYCYLNDVLRMDYTITGGIVSSGKMALITANSSYTFSGIKSSFIPSSFQWSTGETTATINPSPTTTTTYWCDVTTNGVTCRKNVTITVTPKTTPTFTQVAAVCSGATIATLPTTSTNAATGTWLPAVNNTATTTYSFTPTTGLCANTTTMTITVTPKTTPTFTQVAAVNSGATLAALPTTSNNGITGTWSPAINNTVTTLYTFTPTNGLCANTTTMTITVNPILGLSLNSPNYDFCSGNSYTITWTGGTPADLIRLQLADVTSWTTQMLVATNLPNTGSYTWSVPSGLGTGLKLLYIDNVNNRYDYNYGPTFKIYDVTSVTSKSRCGAGTVTLNAIANNGGVINWYATQTGNTLLASGNSFTTPTITATTTYWVDATNGVCTTGVRVPVTATINANVTPTFTQVAAVCSGASLAPLPTTSTNAVTGTWSPAINNLATTLYTFTPTAGLCANTATMTITVNPKTTPTFTQVAAVNSGATLAALPTTSNNGITGTWSPAINNTVTTLYTFTPTNGLCANTATMTIPVNPITRLSINAPNYDLCSGNSYTITWTGGTPSDIIRLYLIDITSWTTQMLVATNLPNIGSYTWTVPSGIGTGLKQLYIDNVNNRLVDYNYGPTFKIYDVTSVTSKSRCGAGTVTLNAIANNGGVINWYATQTGNTLLASGNSFTTPTITATTTYWVDATNGVCTTGVRVPVTATINANVTPTFTQVAAVCSGASLAPLPTTSTNAVTGTWSPAINNLATTLYTFTPTARLCANTATMTITINSTTPAPTGANNQTMTQGSTLANLVVTGQNIIWYSTPFGGTPLPANNTLVNGVTYYASQTINGCESQYRLPVIVEVTLSNKEFDTIKIVYNPNPVTDILNIKASTELKNAKIFNLLGQTIFQQTFNSKEIQLNMSDFPTGTYFVLVESDDINETFKIVKK